MGRLIEGHESDDAELRDFRQALHNKQPASALLQVEPQANEEREVLTFISTSSCGSRMGSSNCNAALKHGCQLESHFPVSLSIYSITSIKIPHLAIKLTLKNVYISKGTCYLPLAKIWYCRSGFGINCLIDKR